MENPCMGKLATPKLPVMWCSASMGSLSDPLAQAFGEHLRLFRTGFRHEDDEFIAAVARHHVRLAGFLLEQSAHASQHQVAFEVAHGVIDFFELVEIDQHHGERPSGARSAFPFGGQRFPEKAAGLDSRQPIGDGLLLQLLEDESVVQCRSEQVGERVENENILRRKRVLVAAFDVEHAEQRFAVSDGNAEHGARVRQNSGADLARQRVLHQGALAGAGHAAENAGAQRDPLAHGMRRRAGFGFDLDLFGAVVEQADADVIEAEIFLNLARRSGPACARDRRWKWRCGKCCSETPVAASAAALRRTGGHSPPRPKPAQPRSSSTSRSRCSKTNSVPVLMATMTPAGLLPSKIGAAIRHLAGCSGR